MTNKQARMLQQLRLAAQSGAPHHAQLSRRTIKLTPSSCENCGAPRVGACSYCGAGTTQSTPW